MNNKPNQYQCIAVFGGVYSNHYALDALLKDGRQRGAEAFFCLGDLGAFGPNPNKVFPLLQKENVQVVQGNYDHSIGNDLNDCQCGYTDPTDNYYAKISYDYTYANTDERWKAWMKELPEELRIDLGSFKMLLCHGSPRKTNEFLWESTTSTHFLEKLCRDYHADAILATHTGLHWSRRLSGNRHFINVGSIGRPANDGRQHVWYAILTADDDQIHVEFIPLEYPYKALAEEMRSERLPDTFIETIESGYWTTCMEVLPGKERKRGKW
ncbi:MAG: metallophosphoesterase family protein [Balneolales bacterium]